MPKSDSPFTMFPTQIDFTSVLDGGEIEQAGIYIFDYDTHVLDFVDQRIQPVKGLDHATESRISTIACGLFHHAPDFGLMRKDLAANSLDFIKPQANGHQSVIGFLKCE